MPGDHPIEAIAAAGAPAFVEGDATAILERAKSYFEDLTGRTLAPSQVEMYLFETVAYLVSILAAEQQLGFQEMVVAYASGEWLDRIGADRSTPRLEAEAATTTLRFATANPAGSAILIPAGTRVRDAAGQVMFLTVTAAQISIGAQSVDVVAQSVTDGTAANGVAIGALNTPVNPVPGIASVQNLTETGGGAARETDDRYRVRLAMAFERLGDGLTRERYEADVRGWSANCIDVAVTRPQPGHVNIYPLMVTGAPSQAEIDALAAFFDASNIHQGDFIQVFAPTAHEFSVELTLVVTVPEAADLAEAAVQDVLDAWEGTLGGYIAPSELIQAARAVEDVVEAEVANLAFAAVAENAWRSCTGVAISVELV